MTNLVSKGHLRLIGGSDGSLKKSKEVESINYVVGSQMALELKSDVIFYFVREADVLQGVDFIGMLEKCRPANIFDVRAAPRLDFVAQNRSVAFKIFTQLNIEYVDVSGQFACESELTAETLAGVVETKLAGDKIFRDALFIFDSDSTLRAAQQHLPDLISGTFKSSNIQVDLLKAGQELIAM